MTGRNGKVLVQRKQTEDKITGRSDDSQQPDKTKSPEVQIVHLHPDETSKELTVDGSGIRVLLSKAPEDQSASGMVFSPSIRTLHSHASHVEAKSI